MIYTVVVSDEVAQFLHLLNEKSKTICKKNLAKLSQPYPGRGPGDKERLVVGGEEIYRLHIGRTYTAFYIIEETTKTVKVFKILPIETAHKRYGY